VWLLSWVRLLTTRQKKAAAIVTVFFILLLVSFLIFMDIRLILYGWPLFVNRPAGVGGTPGG
jgi:hypothetical protein